MSARVLTVRQPWAWAIVHGGKDVENRSRNIAGDFRGRVAIHAGQAIADEDAEIWDKPVYREALASLRASVRHQLDVRGAVIGTANLWAVHQATPGNLCCPKGRGAWGMADHWHLCLNDVLPFAEPIPATGRLGLWRPSPELADQIRDAERRAHLRVVPEAAS